MPSSFPTPPLFSQLFFSLVSLLLFLVLFSSSPISATSNNTNTSIISHKALASAQSPRACVHEHLSALLQLKRGFDFSYSHTNLSSWNTNHSDCCSWEGITCNIFTGQVIGLNLSSLRITGVIDFESLFHLRSLRRLDLSTNEFDGSPIPSGFGQLSSLTHLHLSGCNFSGQIPPDMFRLTRLVSLDLSYNLYHNDSNYAYLELESSGMGQVFRNLSSLKELNLDLVDVSAVGSQWSKILLYGLPNLRKLSMRNCNLSGPIHPSLSRLQFLTHLDLSFNHISSISQSCVNLSQLVHLDLSNNNFQGPIPRFIFELTELIDLDLSSNNFNGVIDLGSFQSLRNLTVLDLSDNSFSSVINARNRSRSSVSISQLVSLFLANNNFSGVIDLGLLQNFRNLGFLDLSYNSLTVINDAESNSTSTSFSQLKHLNLRSCNINKFPDMLRNQEEMQHLDLSCNRISGRIPEWIWAVGNGSLNYLNLSYNALEGLEGPFPHLSLTSMRILDLSANVLKGSTLIPPLSSSFFSLANNALDGEVPSLICNATSLQVLDLSSNNFTGPIPQCLGEISDALIVLNLHKNAFHGPLLRKFKVGCLLETLDLSYNQLEGQMPKSLANCQQLTVLNLGNNRIQDAFPSQLANLSNLGVLVLRSNKFYGSIGGPSTSQPFLPRLQIIDVSFNNFNGSLPPDLFSDWKMMKDGGSASQFLGANFSNGGYYQDKVILVSKGREVEFIKILLALTAVDLSHNRFHGDIPSSIGELKSLHLLNMSCNHFHGIIPASIGDLRDLESLDLSRNRLRGNIPWQLTKLSFLEALDLSQNQLIGSIPRDRQFSAFNNDSFLGNPALCGPPLSRKCEVDAVSTPQTQPENTSELDFMSTRSEVDLMCIGFGVGHAVGFGVFFWTLALWNKGRRTFFMFVDRVFLSFCSFAKFSVV